MVMAVDRPDIACAADAVAIGWAVPGTIEPTEAGVRRWTWRVGDGHWLSACPANRALALEREHQFVDRLALRCDLDLPRAVPTSDRPPGLPHPGLRSRLTSP